MLQLEDRTVPSNLNLSASASPSTVHVGEPVGILGNVYASEPMSGLTATFMWGDGGSSSDPHSYSPSLGMGAISQSHTYTSAGTYSVSVTANATYAAGGNDSATGTYSITILPATSPPPPPPPPPPAPTSAAVQIGTYSNASEQGLIGQFNLVRQGGDLTQPLTVSYGVSGTAASLLDYEPLTGSVTFAANATSATISVTANDDAIYDPDETVTVTLSYGPGYTVITPGGTQTIVIVDNDILALADAVGVWKDNPATVAVLANDTGPGVLAVGSFSQPAHGTVSANGDGTLLYVPNTGYTGSDSFSYTATNDLGGTGTASVSVSVVPPLLAVDDKASTTSNTSVTVAVLANDVGATSIFSFTQPAQGSVTQSGSGLVYTPASGYAGGDAFTYTITDGSQSSTGTVSVFVRGPVAGEVWFDEDGNGMLLEPEAGVVNVAVELVNSDGALVGFTQTDADGQYTFATSKLPDGLYKLHFQDAATITAIQGIEYTLQNVAAPAGVKVSSAASDGWTSPFLISALQQPPAKDAGVKPKGVEIAGGMRFFTVAKQEGQAYALALNLLNNQIEYLPLVLADNKQNAYFLPLSKYDNKNDIGWNATGNVAFELGKLSFRYEYGVLARGKFVEAGHANDASPLAASDKYYWGQYVKLDKQENAVGSFDAWFGKPANPGPPPVDGKWYLDSKQFATGGLKNSYNAQSLNVWHPMFDLPAYNRAVDAVPLTLGGNVERTPAVFSGPNNTISMYVGLTTKGDATAADVKKIKAGNGNQEFTIGYANTFETYIVKKEGINPLGYYTWDWNLTLDSKSQSYGVALSSESPPWVAGFDAAVWDKAPANPNIPPN